jgi:zona occludens toxin
LVLAVLFVVMVLLGVGYKFTHFTGKKSEIQGVQSTSSSAASSGAGGGSAGGGKDKVFDPIADAKQYVAMATPRVQGLAYTAPKYDELTKPTHVPIPAMCMQKGSVADGDKVSCKCLSQQGTPLDVPFNMCIEFARNGFFREFDPDREQQAIARTERAVEVLSNRPDAPVPVRQVQNGPVVTVLPGKSMGPQRTDTSPGLNEAGEIEDGPPNNRATRAAAGAGVAG